MTTFDYSKHCNKKLFEKFPELLEYSKYGAYIQEAYEIGVMLLDDETETRDSSAHLIYEDVFCNYVLDLIKNPHAIKNTRQKLKAAFDLIEELANHEEFEVRCVAEVSFIEKFTHDLKPMKDVEKYLGPTSLKMAREIAQERYGRNPVTWEEE